MNGRRPTGKLIEESGPCLWNCDLDSLMISAYCDFMDGPVIAVAKQAMKKRVMLRRLSL